jgi:hypothetical protein
VKSLGFMPFVPDSIDDRCPGYDADRLEPAASTLACADSMIVSRSKELACSISMPINSLCRSRLPSFEPVFAKIS